MCLTIFLRGELGLNFCSSSTHSQSSSFLIMTSGFWEGCCKLPEMYPQHMKIGQGTHISCWFSYYPNIFHPKYLQTKHYESISMTVWILNLFILWMFIKFSVGWGGKSDTCLCFYLVGRQLWLISGLRSHSASGEKSLFLCTVSNGTHWLAKELSTVPTFALQSTFLMVIFHSLTEKFQPWGIKCRGRECLGFDNFSGISKAGTEDLER